MAALALIDPRALSTGGRVLYRGALAAMTAWTVWTGVRPRRATDPDPIGPVGRAAVVTGAVGAAIGLAPAGEAIDARIHGRLVRGGVRQPRLWIAAGNAVLSLGAWWAARSLDDAAEMESWFDVSSMTTTEVPDDVRAVAARLLGATDGFGATELREQLARARATTFVDGELQADYVAFEVADDAPRAVPGNATFPVIGRFRALDNRTFDVRLTVADGHLNAYEVVEGADWSNDQLDAWETEGNDVGQLESRPDAGELELLIETPNGYEPLER